MYIVPTTFAYINMIYRKNVCTQWCFAIVAAVRRHDFALRNQCNLVCCSIFKNIFVCLCCTGYNRFVGLFCVYVILFTTKNQRQCVNKTHREQRIECEIIRLFNRLECEFQLGVMRQFLKHIFMLHNLSEYKHNNNNNNTIFSVAFKSNSMNDLDNTQNFSLFQAQNKCT